MNITIIGNPQRNGDTISALATTLTEAGINVRYPAENALNTTEDISLEETFDRIDWSDWTIIIPIEGISFDRSSTGAMAYAKHIHKPIFIYYS